MNRRDALLLRVIAAWTVVVWAVLVKNLFTNDHDAGFIIVHGVLAVVSIGFAVATWQLATRNRREAKERAHQD